MVKGKSGGLYQTLRLTGFNYKAAKNEAYRILGMRDDSVRMPDYWEYVDRILPG